jgi:uncharacterized ubiquitin-like protein YukD
MASQQSTTLSTKPNDLAPIQDKIIAFPLWNSLSFAMNPQKLGWLQHFLALKIWLHDADATILSPPYKVDELWHEMVLHTKLYRSFQEYMEITIDHDPNGKSEDAASRMQRQERYEVTKSLWIQMYGCSSWDQVKEEEDDLGSEVRIGCLQADNHDEVHEQADSNEAIISHEPTMLLTVKAIIAERSFSITVLSQSSIRDLKLVIEAMECIPSDRQRLIFKGKQLEDGRVLSDCKIVNGSVLYLFERPDESGLNITVKTLARKSIPISLPMNATVLDLKLAVRSKEGIETHDYTLVFAGKQLGDENRKLADFNICNGATLHLVLKYRC